MTSEPQPDTPALAETRWPKVLGVISIIWGFCEIVPGVIVVIMLVVSPLIKSNHAETGEFSLFAIGLAALALAGFLLFAGGILLLAKRHLARTFHLIYGAAGLLLGLAIACTPLFHMAKSELAEAGGLFGCNIAFTVSYPIFCLVWFSRKSIRDQMAAWAQAPVGRADPGASQQANANP